MCLGPSLIIYEQFPEILEVMRAFLINYVYNFWFLQIGTQHISVFGQDHRTNNYLESFHSTLIKQMGRHPNIWDFLRKLPPQLLMWAKRLYLYMLFVCDYLCLYLYMLYVCDYICYMFVLYVFHVCKTICVLSSLA